MESALLFVVRIVDVSVPMILALCRVSYFDDNWADFWRKCPFDCELRATDIFWRNAMPNAIVDDIHRMKNKKILRAKGIHMTKESERVWAEAVKFFEYFNTYITRWAVLWHWHTEKSVRLPFTIERLQCKQYYGNAYTLHHVPGHIILFGWLATKVHDEKSAGERSQQQESSETKRAIDRANETESVWCNNKSQELLRANASLYYLLLLKRYKLLRT